MVPEVWRRDGGAESSRASYSAASGGDRYVVTTGLIAVGIGRLIRGVMRLLSATRSST